MKFFNNRFIRTYSKKLKLKKRKDEECRRQNINLKSGITTATRFRREKHYEER